MDFIAVEPFFSIGAKIVDDFTVPDIHFRNSGHALFAEGKIPDDAVFLNVEIPGKIRKTLSAAYEGRQRAFLSYKDTKKNCRRPMLYWTHNPCWLHPK